MSEFKVGDKVVWKDREYAQRIYPDLIDKVMLVTNVDEDDGELYLYTLVGTLVAQAYAYRFRLYEEKESDIINKPQHYSLFPEHDIEVKDVVKLWLDRWERNAKIELSFYNAACLKEMLCYVLRSPLKNEVEDLKKSRWYLDEVIKELENKQ